MTALRLLANAAVLGGVCSIAIGGFGLWEGSGYTVGTARNMGPGYFPVVLGGLLVALGVVLLLQGIFGGSDPVEQADLRALVAVMAAIGAFALLVGRAGLVPAVMSLVVLGGLAAGQVRPLRLFMLGVALSGLSYLVFRVFLNLPLPAFPGLG